MICRALDVEIIRDWSIGHDEYWGKIGHFAIGWKACENLTGALSVLMKKNRHGLVSETKHWVRAPHSVWDGKGSYRWLMFRITYGS